MAHQGSLDSDDSGTDFDFGGPCCEKCFGTAPVDPFVQCLPVATYAVDANDEEWVRCPVCRKHWHLDCYVSVLVPTPPKNKLREGVRIWFVCIFCTTADTE
jgi:hypothetical protein